MKIVHLLSNRKWTGPAEPALNLATKLKERGHEVHFACGIGEDGGSIVAERAAERGLPLIGGLRLGKHRRILADARDAKRLADWLRRAPPDVVHAHMDNDHAVAAKALRGVGRRVVFARSLYAGDAASMGRRTRRLIRGPCEVLFVFSSAVAAAAREALGPQGGRVRQIEGAIDTERFYPRGRNAEIRAALGLGADDFVAGIVARMQRHRRFDVFFAAIRRAARALPNLKALVIGRGTHAREVGGATAERLGIADRVIFAGYRGEDYVDVANCMDVKVYLVPGSDGSCRAVRECMALGKPVIAARRGMLPEIVEDGTMGIVIDDTEENLAGAIVNLGADPAGRSRMAAAAAAAARERFSLSAQAEAVEESYRSAKNNQER